MKTGVVEALNPSTLQSCRAAELTSVAFVVEERMNDETVNPTVVDGATLITLDGVTVPEVT